MFSLLFFFVFSLVFLFSIYVSIIPTFVLCLFLKIYPFFVLCFFFLFSDKLHELTNYAGEAVYVDDIPTLTNCLHGAFIYSTKPFARVKGIKLKPQSMADRVSALISFKEIPGENIGAKNRLGSEPLFVDEFTRCAGQYIAFVVIP